MAPENITSRIALVTPVRDEAGFIGAMIESIAGQTVRPLKWIIVDDGSTDATCEIVRDYARRHAFITLIELPPRSERQPGGENAISHGLHSLELGNYDFIARFDADLQFEPNYLEQILAKFSADPTLGIAGGGLYIQENGRLRPEKAPDYHVRGALKMYRTECYRQIGGLRTSMGWDTIDEVFAWTKGWTTRSFFEYRVIHRRPTGEGIRAHRIYWERGKAEYATWSHPLFVVLKTPKLAIGAAGPVAAICFLAGFVSAYLRRLERLQDAAFVNARRGQQWKRMAAPIASRKSSPLPLPVDVRSGQ
jgi:glycosyltransferase involved in cell wall biosynthesis